MLRWMFKRTQKPPKPICFHEWFLVDMRIVDSYIFNDSPEVRYEIVCKSCETRKSLDKYEYHKFCEVFDVKGGREDATR
ncbi:hypothetical protein J2T19_000143 [Paenibacillus tundrae]|uniref:Uncharacterized protein n=1 Tax=Paenibacillus tundrae TaxID=528187 RepID=A0ABT9W639_9BACL|nr:hypothetical protein [Paenibacillus tundrae]